jgi:cell division protein FtsB
MGGKQSGRGKQIYLCVAILICLSPAACAFNRMMSTKMVDVTGEEALAHLAQGRKFLAREDYGNALKENESVLSLAGRNTPVDEALFYLGLIHALPVNPARNYGKSVVSFRRLIKEYPGSSWVEQAKAMVELLQENDNLNRRVDRLNNIIDELKKVDIAVAQMKAEHAKTIEGLMQENDKLNRTVDRLNNIIDELKKVDIGVDQKKREQIK